MVRHGGEPKMLMRITEQTENYRLITVEIRKAK
jgi:hypothetical protein